MNDMLLFIFFGLCWVGSIVTSFAVFAGIRSLITPLPPKRLTPEAKLWDDYNKKRSPYADWKIEYTETAPPVHWRGDGGKQ